MSPNTLSHWPTPTLRHSVWGAARPFPGLVADRCGADRVVPGLAEAKLAA